MSLNWRGGINVDSRQAYEAIKTRLMPDWRCERERDCICTPRRPDWPISTLSHSPSHINTKPYNFPRRAARRSSLVAFAVKRQHSQARAKNANLLKAVTSEEMSDFYPASCSQRGASEFDVFLWLPFLQVHAGPHCESRTLEKSRERNWVNFRDFCGVAKEVHG